MQQEPIRAFALAQQLNVETRDLLEAARALGIDLRNHLSQVPLDRQAALEEHVKKMFPQLTASAQPISPIAPDADADDRDDIEDDPAEDDFDEDDEDFNDEEDDEDFNDEENDDEEGTGGGYRVDHTEDREYREDYEPEEDDKESSDFEAEGPEEFGCDPDYDY